MSHFHGTLAIALFLDQVILGIWALIVGFRRRAIGSGLFSALLVDEILMVLQSLAGAVLLATGLRPQPLHFLYGGLLLALLPGVYAYAGRRDRAGIWLGLTLLFMGAMIITRTTATGR